ncbi:PEP-utilizing enzyme, partial [Candidatus Pelagibacter ubique]|nr:PEP-utilizing enzyme [Candidatus Pelagibacter ubique]
QSKKITPKVKNLFLIKKKIKKINVPNFYCYNVELVKKNLDNFVNKIFNLKYDIIIRSSSSLEDLENQSNAGKYDSIVIFKNKKNIIDLKKKIKKFLKQFKKKKDQLFFQKYMSNVDYAGVIFTKDPSSGSPYYIISYDESGTTDRVTSGKNIENKKIIIYKNSKKYPKKFLKLIKLTKLIQKKIKSENLDIEFCYKNKKIYILQCREILKKKNSNEIDFKFFDQIIVNIRNKIKHIQKKNNLLHGNINILSNMSDWNPAEIIGDKPNELAISLYSELITDYVWSKQRRNYGYQNVFPHKLMFDIGGSPYIDLRTDINSFLPDKLPKTLSKKLVNYYLSELKRQPHLHDKIEFELIETCFNFNYNKNIKNFLNYREWKNYQKSLLDLTRNILSKEKNLLNIELENSKKNLKFLQIIKNSEIHPINKIFEIINFCKKYGTLSFAGVARCAFISTRILKSLVVKNLISDQEFSNFYFSLNIVTDRMNKSLFKIKDKKSKDNFIKQFGHIRPELYNINSPNYKNNFKSYFKNLKKFNYKKIKNKLKFKNNKKLSALFEKSNLNITFSEFIEFASKSISLREELKYSFSKSVDAIFNELNNLFDEIKLNKKDICHINIKDILHFNNNLSQFKLKEILLDSIKKNKIKQKYLNLVKLPEIILNDKNILFYQTISTKENFVTNNIINSTSIKVMNSKNNFGNLKNKIVFIKNADPGYDFIFNHKISGLVTAYGGSNSHMAIRCLELDIPAVMGLGIEKFNILKQQKSLYINCKDKIIKTLN